MSDSSLDELRAKLTKSRNQLKQVTKMLAAKPNNETVKNLQTDLERVIELTENLLKMKEQKYSEAKKRSGRSLTTVGPDGKEQPREWGQPKDEWKIGERCQAKFTDNHWYVGAITDVVAHPQGGVGKGYQILFLEYGDEHVGTVEHMRTYVPPLKEQVQVGDRVRACWGDDGMFYKAIIQRITEEGKYDVEFTKYKNKASIPLEDIQLVKEKKAPIVKTVDKKGWTHIAEEVYIPDSLKAKPKDPKEVLDKKRLKKRKLKKRHRRMLKEAEQDNRQNAWKRFKKKGDKSTKKVLKANLFRKAKSIFAAPEGLEGRVGVYGSGLGMTEFGERTHFHNLKRAGEEEEEE